MAGAGGGGGGGYSGGGGDGTAVAAVPSSIHLQERFSPRFPASPAPTAHPMARLLFTAVPEPGTLTLLVSALLGLAGAAYLRRRQAKACVSSSIPGDKCAHNYRGRCEDERVIA